MCLSIFDLKFALPSCLLQLLQQIKYNLEDKFKRIPFLFKLFILFFIFLLSFVKIKHIFIFVSCNPLYILSSKYVSRYPKEREKVKNCSEHAESTYNTYEMYEKCYIFYVFVNFVCNFIFV